MSDPLRATDAMRLATRCSPADRRRRRLTWVVALAYVAATAGVPLAADDAGAGGPPFPCQFHRCGCRTAEQCRRRCCCFTPQQKQAWAREFGVAAPPERPDSAASTSVAPRRCCAARGRGASSAACCRGDRAERRPADVSLQSERCRGAVALWCTLAGGLPPLRIDAERFDPLVGRTSPRPSLWTSPPLVPDAPPPRAS